MPTKPHPDPDRERGSVSLWAALVAFCMVIIVGIGVDFSGQAVAEQKARSIAFEAARAGGQQVNRDALIRGGQTQTDPNLAAAAASDYLAQAGVTGAVTVAANSVTVNVVDTYHCRFLSIIGITSLPVSGSASADTLRVLEGAER